MRVLFSRKELAGVQEVIAEMEQIARERDIPPWVASRVAARQAWVWLAQGNVEAAAQWAKERGLDVDGVPSVAREVEYLALARIRIDQGRPGETARLLQRLLERAEAGGDTARAIEILMLKALALQAQEDADQALTVLEHALALAKPGGFVRIFVDQGPPMARLLYQAAAGGVAGHDSVAQYARQLLSAFPVVEPERTDASEQQAPQMDLIEPLSERELEILEIIAEGLTNPEIASRLCLSPNTVKAHAHNIYGKLDVRNRTQAVSRARVLGLLAPL
jgi:LuxR family maltose regulon positive regulatory protein